MPYTKAHIHWFGRIRDRQAGVLTGPDGCRLATLPGDARPVGEGVSELRIDCRCGYRVYYAQRGESMLVLPARGDKDSRDRDIMQRRSDPNQLNRL